MIQILHLLIFIPLLGFLLSLFIPGKREYLMSRVAFLSVGLHMICAQLFSLYWLLNGHPLLNIKDISLFKTIGYEYFIDFYFDKTSMVYLLVGSLLIFLVTTYSRYYLHKEGGYKRFFNNLLFFYFGYNLIILSGNLETLFIGWEILGISSFLLIAFYRDRYLPVKNAVKVFSIYRIGDVGIILAMWLTHHLFHENITFYKLINFEIVHEHLQAHTFTGVIISLLIFLSAAAKSAQLPFSSWLPRAMEGPTPSSAIFYGSLAVHLGVFLMLRTFPLWEHQITVRIFIALLGLATSIVTSGIARVQSSVKTQIAYSSISQIGIIFIELALGLEILALIHFAGNAFLRTYQLLVSPSVVSYLIKEQFYNFIPRKKTIESIYPKKLANSIYILCVKEWNMDIFMYRFLWNPFKKGGKLLHFLSSKNVFIIFISAYIIGISSLFLEAYIPKVIHQQLPVVFAFIGLLMVLKSFIERKNSQLAWLLIVFNHFWIALAISFNEHFIDIIDIHLYLSGITISGILGYACLRKLKTLEFNIKLDKFRGHSYEYPKLAFLFLLACLGISGFPITPTFIGEDLIFTHIHADQILLASFVSLSLLIDGIAAIRIFARIFLGPHIKSYHEVAYRYS